MNHHKIRPLAAVTSTLAVAALAAVALAHDDHGGAISAGKLAKDAKNYYGQTVTVHAEVEDAFDTHSFTLDEDALLAGGDVLVLVPGGLNRLPVHDEKLMVTGKVRRYVQSELKRDLDFFDEGKIINKKMKVDYETRPVVVATAVKTADGRDLMGAKSTSLTDDSDLSTISATTLVKDPKAYYGKRVSVQAEVEDVLSANAFTLEEDAMFKGPDVLVLIPRGVAEQLTHDTKVTVRGTVRPWVQADLDKDLAFFQNGKIVSKETKVDWKTRPVLVADAVITPDGRDLLGS